MEAHMTLRKTMLAPALSGLALLCLATGLADANHVRILPPPAAPAVVAPETLQVDDIMAQQVRARAIYANRIEADHVQGAIHQIAGLQTLNGHGEINAADVSASVIYADTINANSVIADAIYVRDLRIK
jgi:hypothetical protein